MEYEDYLAGLDEPALTALLRARPDVLVEPAPRGLAALAQRLCSASSLVIVLQALNRDQLVVGEAITGGRLDRLDQALLPAVLDQLRALGLLWGPDLRLPPLLSQHWSMDRTADAVLTGRPELPLVRTDAATVLRAAQAAASALLDGVTSLLDKATAKPITALKKGGIGTKEVSRLARELAAEPETVALWLDLAGLSGLLGDVEEGFAPTTDFPRWRDLGPGRRWTDLAQAWLTETECGPMRRALLTAAAGGVSVRAAVAELDWFCPDLGDEDHLEQLVRDAETLGLVALDVLTDLGEFLAGRRDGVDDVLPEQATGVILQSDLTAIVAGPPPRVILAAAEREAGAVWRFSAASVRAALDAGWTAEDLLRELGPTPQPLTYLINDVDRRHGHVRVREVRCCVVADEATATEIAHRLKGFTQLAPTVLSSSDSPANVLALLRNAGYAPVTEDHAGTVVVEHAKEHMAEAIADRTTVTAEELAARLIAEPHVSIEGGATFDRLSRQNHTLHPVELALLAHAIDTEDDVVIGYRDRNGSRTVRRIRPEQLLSGWLDSWCYLREEEREFAVANIESVEAAW